MEFWKLKKIYCHNPGQRKAKLSNLEWYYYRKNTTPHHHIYVYLHFRAIQAVQYYVNIHENCALGFLRHRFQIILAPHHCA